LILRRRQAVPRLPLRLKPVRQRKYDNERRGNEAFPAERIHPFSLFLCGDTNYLVVKQTLKTFQSCVNRNMDWRLF
jgi:hypothetical protein